MAPKAFSRKAIEIVKNIYVPGKNDTGFIYYFTKTNILNVFKVKPISDGHILNEARLTLDYEEDFNFISAIFNSLYYENKIFHISELVSFLKNNNHLLEINSYLEEDYWARTEKLVDLEYVDTSGKIQKIKL